MQRAVMLITSDRQHSLPISRSSARFRAAVGSGNENLGREVMAEVDQYAKVLAPSVTHSEGTGIVVILLEKESAARCYQATPAMHSSQPEPKPAESKSGGERPTTPASELARPDPDAQKAGAQPASPVQQK
ncbi:hypothetical protein [Bradyrhizobium cenepequi]|uniref:hypothetical protein n=1 Tax=Bradyrhizobium cenepequi TaxID=2821403 RepID=UPI001CE3939C|nr:hypothetical protein [Bradyrhizobium cenepequi]MCA6110725.1 hypothetical protein [Bradyrhizobium cenepequi]